MNIMTASGASVKRRDFRLADGLRSVRIERGYQKYPAGSALIDMGHTRVICAATVEERVPFFLKGTGTGWITAEYAMLPTAGATRSAREASRGRQSGRTQEIQRLIGRALRSVVDLEALGERTIHIDCDAVQADGGTRTASITGAFVAMVEACASFYQGGVFPIRDYVAAVSVGIVPLEEIAFMDRVKGLQHPKHNKKILPNIAEVPLLDLCYEEDSKALVDMNVVMTGSGDFVEIQGTGEGRPFKKAENDVLIALAEKGILELIEQQKAALGDKLAWLPGREN